MDIEDIRKSFRPERIKILFIGESPPASGKFFYNANSRAYFEIEAALGKVITGGDNFLISFKLNSCYLDDHCSEPINRNTGRQRKFSHKQNIDGLATRIREYSPQLVIAFLKSIHRPVQESIRRSQTVCSYHCVPFPGLGQQKNFRREMSALIPEIQDVLKN